MARKKSYKKKRRKQPLCGDCLSDLEEIEKDDILIKVICPKCGIKWEKKKEDIEQERKARMKDKDE